MSLPLKLRRVALDTLDRDRLFDLADRLEVEVADRRSKNAAVDALSRSTALNFAAILEELTRDELKGICGALELDDSGKGKAQIIARIIAAGDQPSGGRGVRGPDGDLETLKAAELLLARSTCCETCIACRETRADLARVAVAALGLDGFRRLGLRALMGSSLRDPVLSALKQLAVDASQAAEWRRVLDGWFDDASSDPLETAFLVNRFLGELSDSAVRRWLRKAEALAIASRNIDLVRILLKRSDQPVEAFLQVAAALAAGGSVDARRLRKELRSAGRPELVKVGEAEQGEDREKLFRAIRSRDRNAIAALLQRKPDLHRPGKQGLSPIEYMRKHRPELADLFG